MLFPSRFLVKNCRRCGKNVRIDKEELTDNAEALKQALNEEFYCPYCGNLIGRIVVDKEKNHMDIAM